MVPFNVRLKAVPSTPELPNDKLEEKLRSLIMDGAADPNRISLAQVRADHVVSRILQKHAQPPVHSSTLWALRVLARGQAVWYLPNKRLEQGRQQSQPQEETIALYAAATL